MKKHILIGLSILIGTATFCNAQQIPHHSQYMFNDFFINPAVAGTKSYQPIMVTARNQWVGLSDAPTTQTMSFHGSWINNMGLGLIIANDVTGPARQAGLQLAYSYHILLKDEIYLSLGLSGSVTQHILNKSTIDLDDPNDNALLTGNNETIVPDASFGVYCYGKQFYFGIAAPQLFESKVDFNTSDQLETNSLTRHYYMHAGYKFKTGDDIEIEPSLLIKGIKNAPFQFDINTKVIVKEFAWLGCSYRSMESIVALLGLEYKDIALGYSYDFTLTSIKKYSTGSHELFLAYLLPYKNNPAEKEKRKGLMN